MTSATHKLLYLLGKGQGGEVWAAVNEAGTVVAVKLFSPTGPREAAEAEYKRGAALSHPNIITPQEFIGTDAQPAMVIPFCDGRSVDNAAGYFNEVMAWKLLSDIGAALAYLHAANLCHGDVKPSNILRKGRAFLLADFGSCFESQTGHPAGDLSSYQFAAPESTKTEKSDVWSLGAAVFNLVMGIHVFNGLGGKAQQKETEIPFMRKSMPELSALIYRCLAFDASARPSPHEIVSLAEKNLERLSAAGKSRPVKISVKASAKDKYGDFWPETMCDAI